MGILPYELIILWICPFHKFVELKSFKMVVKVFFSSNPGSADVKKKQDYVLWTLEGKKIDHEPVDISDPNRIEDRKVFRRLKETLGQIPKPPQVFKDEDLIGDYDKFFEAIESERLYEYLQIDPPEDSYEYIIKNVKSAPPEETKKDKKKEKKEKKKKADGEGSEEESEEES